MGVNSLAKLIKSAGVILPDYERLSTDKIVIDGNNLAEALLKQLSDPPRLGNAGVNLVAYRKKVELVFNSLKECKIESILAFDGAQTNNTFTSKTSKKTEQIEEHIRNAEELNKLESRYIPPGVLPASIKMILKAIALEKQAKVVQCFSEGKKHIAKIANDCDSLVLSDDRDFLILGVKRGVILMDSLKFEDVKLCNGFPHHPTYHYMCCCLFDQSHFVSRFPGLDKRCLPLLGSIAGNKVSEGMLDFLLFLVPRNLASPTRDRLRMLLEFLCNKSLEQNIKSLTALVEADKREEIEDLIRESIRYYDLPEEDKFDKEISKHYKEAFCKTYSGKFGNDFVKANDVAEKEMRLLSHWLKKKIDTTNLTRTSLDFALRDIIFLRSEIDDYTEPSAYKCINRYRSVMLALMRSSHDDNQPRSFYDREGDSNEMFKLQPLLELENYGPIDYLIYDVCDDLSDDIVTTKLTQSEKTALLLATFHSSTKEFLVGITQYNRFLQPEDAEEFVVLKLLVRYVELEEDVIFPRFRDSVLVTYLYYLHYGDQFKAITKKNADESYLGFLDNLNQLTCKYYLEAPNHWTITGCDMTIVRNIVQMQNVIRAYEELNAFLGTSLPTLRMHKWFCSSYIYNFAASIEPGSLTMPSIVYDK